MARIRLNLKNLTIPEKIAKGRQIVSAMTSNSSFANPTPALPDVTARLDQLDKAFASVQAAKSEVSTRVVTQDNAATDVDQILTQLAGYVESVAGRDDTIITSAGMETKASRTPPTTPTSAAKAINNLKSGTRYWFRVAAVGAGGQSGWSEHATKVAP